MMYQKEILYSSSLLMLDEQDISLSSMKVDAVMPSSEEEFQVLNFNLF